jgi:hypothetical protein
MSQLAATSGAEQADARHRLGVRRATLLAVSLAFFAIPLDTVGARHRPVRIDGLTFQALMQQLICKNERLAMRQSRVTPADAAPGPPLTLARFLVATRGGPSSDARLSPLSPGETHLFMHWLQTNPIDQGGP